MTYLKLATGLFRGFSTVKRVIQKELRERGYKRHPANEKSPSSQVTIIKYRNRAETEAYLHWTFEYWSSIHWTNET